MRIDKYLKVSRLIKRRTLAKDVTESERILVNGKVVKPSYQVKIGDEVSIIFGTKTITVRVLSLEATTKKAEATSLYEFVSETINQQEG